VAPRPAKLLRDEDAVVLQDPVNPDGRRNLNGDDELQMRALA
jgi:hypothetical protein